MPPVAIFAHTDKFPVDYQAMNRTIQVTIGGKDFYFE